MVYPNYPNEGVRAAFVLDNSGNVIGLRAPNTQDSQGADVPGALITIGGSETALTDAVSIATDCNTGSIFTVTLGGNRTLANPTNIVNGATYLWVIMQDGTGSRTLAYGNKFKWPGASVPVLSTAIGAVDIISAVAHGGNVYAAIQQAFA